MDEAPCGSCEDYRGVRREINGDSSVTQPPLKVVEVCLQVADEECGLVGRGYDGCVVRVESYLDVVQG